MEVFALASGSSGNCFYIGDKQNGILIDAGISSKQICERLQNKQINPERIKGIFLTHEHTDHIKGVDVLARQFNIPIFSTKETLKSRFICSEQNLLFPIKNAFDFLDFHIKAFPKIHKAIDPISFTIEKNRKTVSIITDVGIACKNVTDAISKSDFLFIESNHDINMLENGCYPKFLKEWIKSETGHLSNEDSAKCVLDNQSKKLKSVVLSHLSENNNTPETALTTWAQIFYAQKNKPEIYISTREATNLFKI
jgi:phosphoribosyl 1,2-cyclic phosphodiesterase